ncbi:MAG: GNAT family N-acetyltransferase [Ginsengibacter sp.]
MNELAFTLRKLQLSDIADAMKLSSAEGWNQTKIDWKFLIENPENICMAAKYDNKIIGTTTAINYSNQVAWIGMVLVDKEYRGYGVSKTLLRNIFEKLEFCKSVKLDATPDGQHIYKKFNFKDQYPIVRMVGEVIENLPSVVDNDVLIESINPNDIPEIIALDEFAFGANRSVLIDFLIRKFPHKGWVLKRNDRIVGITLGRDGNKYHQVGPVVASCTADAKILISKALKMMKNQSMVVDVTGDKEELIDWLCSLGFVIQRQFIRMYQRINYFPGAIDRQFLIGGPEIG